MKITIAKDVLLVAPLEVGKDLQGGDEVEVDEGTAREWIARKWATAISDSDSGRSTPVAIAVPVATKEVD